MASRHLREKGNWFVSKKEFKVSINQHVGRPSVKQDGKFKVDEEIDLLIAIKTKNLQELIVT